MSVKDLSVLETVKEVTEFVLVQASHPQFRSLSFLRNLEVIHGRKLGRFTKLHFSSTFCLLFRTLVVRLLLYSLLTVHSCYWFIDDATWQSAVFICWFFASGYCRLGFTSVCGVVFILLFYFTFTSLLCHSFYIALSILSVLYCVYDFIINK